MSLTLAKAVSAEGWLNEVSWKGVLKACVSLDKSGCALAWSFFNGHDVSRLQGNSFFVSCIFSSNMGHRASPRAAFPMKLGEFAAVKAVFQKKRLEEAIEDQFVSLWAQRAWTVLASFACHSLWKDPVPFLEGDWNREAKALVKAVDQSVSRMRTHGLAEFPDIDGLEKELLGKRVNYSGEEVGVCHKLTFEQVAPALPPAEHGGSIDVLKFVSRTTKSFLMNPEVMVVTDVGQELPKLQGRIHIEKGDEGVIAKELVRRGICSWTPLEEVAVFRGQKNPEWSFWGSKT